MEKKSFHLNQLDIERQNETPLTCKEQRAFPQRTVLFAMY